MVMRGQEALKATPNLLKVPDTDQRAKDRIEGSMAAVEGELKIALKAMPPEYAEQALQAAREYQAGVLWNKGLGNVSEGYSEGGYRDAMRVALGGYKKDNAGTAIGGIGHWADNRPFVVPDGFSEPGFEVAVLRDRHRQEKEQRGPVDRDGKTPFDLKKAWPVMIRPGLYRWETSGGTVLNGRGERYISFVRAGE
jgi:hypothetical protein